MGIKMLLCTACTSELKEKAKQRPFFEYFLWINYEHVDRNAGITSPTASSYHTHKTMIIIKNHKKVCPLIFSA